MNVKRYFAKTAREALRMLKDDLGPDAVVLANRAANGGVEILALPAGDVASLQRARSQAQAQPPLAPLPLRRLQRPSPSRPPISSTTIFVSACPAQLQPSRGPRHRRRRQRARCAPCS
jgi:flagellar biosynthesis GTPase FlhF